MYDSVWFGLLSPFPLGTFGGTVGTFGVAVVTEGAAVVESVILIFKIKTKNILRKIYQNRITATTVILHQGCS